MENDLKHQLLQEKLKCRDLREENDILKVKIRKLQSETQKLQKQNECLLDPIKYNSIRNFISDNGAQMIMKMKQENKQLEESLTEKNLIIKRLENKIRIHNAYLEKQASRNKISVTQRKKEEVEKDDCVRLIENLRKIKSANLGLNTTQKDSYNIQFIDVKSMFKKMSEDIEEVKSIMLQLVTDNFKDIISNPNTPLERKIEPVESSSYSESLFESEASYETDVDDDNDVQTIQKED